jgi:ribonuclease P/MRP protein subunit POP5
MRLLPSLREKRRYLAFGILSENGMSRHDFTEGLRRSASSLLGDAGESECGMHLLSFDGSGGIVRCVHTHVTQTRAALAAIHEIRDLRIAVYVIGISGTVKGAKRFFGDGA